MPGEQLPDICRRAAGTVVTAAHESAWYLATYTVAIAAALLTLRFLWVWVSLRVVIFRAGRRGEVREDLSWHVVATTTLAGVKGAITLAGVLTLPHVMPDGSLFPARDLAIFLTICVILLSLGLASALLRGLLKSLRLPMEELTESEEDRARQIAVEAAVKAIKKLLVRGEVKSHSGDPTVFAEAAERAMERYSRRANILKGSDVERARHRELTRIERRLRLAGRLRAEREELFQLRRHRKIEDGLLRSLVREVDL